MNEDFSDFAEMFSIPDINNFENMMARPAQSPFSSADLAFDGILQNIRAFERFLDDNQQIGILFPGYGEENMLIVTEVTNSGDAVVFSGLCGDSPAVVFKPLSAPDFMLKAVPVPDGGSANRVFTETD